MIHSNNRLEIHTSRSRQTKTRPTSWRLQRAPFGIGSTFCFLLQRPAKLPSLPKFQILSIDNNHCPSRGCPYPSSSMARIPRYSEWGALLLEIEIRDTSMMFFWSRVSVSQCAPYAGRRRVTLRPVRIVNVQILRRVV